MSSSGVISLPRPKMYLTGAVSRPSVDSAFGYDEFARAAEETFRNSYDPMPTCNAREFATFFSRKNYEMLYREVVRQAGDNPDANELMETMFRAFSMVAPRSDEMDDRRTKFDDATIISYVKECNAKVLEDIVTDVIAGNQQEKYFRTHRWRPGPEFEADEDMHFGVDTRTRLNGSMYDATYLQP
jgi:hypothetical protein